MNITHSNFYPEKKQNYNSQKVKGIAQIGVAGAIGYKGITSGIRRALGVRIEEHTTSGKNAKQIIKNGCILDPQFGGTGAAATKVLNQLINPKDLYI